MHHPMETVAPLLADETRSAPRTVLDSTFNFELFSLEVQEGPPVIRSVLLQEEA
jgi:hypothetical protein